MRRLVLLLLVGLACVGGRQWLMQQPRTILTVENNSFYDHTIYLMSPYRVRLGIARGLATTRLRIPEGAVGGTTTLRFQSDGIGDAAHQTTEGIVCPPGSDVVLTITDNQPDVVWIRR